MKCERHHTKLEVSRQRNRLNAIWFVIYAHMPYIVVSMLIGGEMSAPFYIITVDRSLFIFFVLKGEVVDLTKIEHMRAIISRLDLSNKVNS